MDRTRENRQIRVYAHAKEMLGAEAMEPAERLRRFMEEAIELAQSLGMSLADVERLARYVYRRPEGQPFQEIGGVALTLMALSQSIGVSVEHAEVTEYERFMDMDPVAFRKKHNLKAKAGVATRV